MKAKKTKPTSPTLPRDDRSSVRRLSALVRQLAAQGRFGEAVVAIERLFAAIAGPQSKRSPQLLHEARRSFLVCQRELLEQNHPAAAQAAADLQVETERLADYPIRVSFEDDIDLPGGSGVKLAWEHGSDHHSLVCRRGPEEFRPYELASGLLRIQSETEACRVGKSRVPTVSEMQKRELLSMFAPVEAQLLAAQGGVWVTLNPHPDDIALFPLGLLLASAPFMLVDATLRRRFPVLRPAQFLSRSTAFLAHWKAREDDTEIPPTQRFRERTISALDGLEGLYLDWLFNGATDFAARYRDLDGFDLAQKLWLHWEAGFPVMQPGDEFSMLDGFAEILGLSGRFGWLPGPSKRDGTEPASPNEASAL